MKTWDDCSDKEINQAVTHTEFALGGWELAKDGDSFFHCGIDGSGHYCQDVINYCESWDDTGPIIAENSITINHDMCQAYVSSYFAEHIKVSVKPEKILRAAAILFLMMNGVRP